MIKPEDYQRMLAGLRFIAAAEQVDTEALGGVIDYPQPDELIELLRELKPELEG